MMTFRYWWEQLEIETLCLESFGFDGIKKWFLIKKKINHMLPILFNLNHHQKDDLQHFDNQIFFHYSFNRMKWTPCKTAYDAGF